jgi:hypothetical protein
MGDFWESIGGSSSDNPKDNFCHMVIPEHFQRQSQKQLSHF